MKKIQKSETHDRLSVWGTYNSGGSFRFTVGRSGERISFAGSNNLIENQTQMRKFVEFCKFKGTETNGQRIQRIYETAMKAESIAEFISLM